MASALHSARSGSLANDGATFPHESRKKLLVRFPRISLDGPDPAAYTAVITESHNLHLYAALSGPSEAFIDFVASAASLARIRRKKCLLSHDPPNLVLPRSGPVGSG